MHSDGLLGVVEIFLCSCFVFFRLQVCIAATAGGCLELFQLFLNLGFLLLELLVCLLQRLECLFAGLECSFVASLFLLDFGDLLLVAFDGGFRFIKNLRYRLEA